MRRLPINIIVCVGLLLGNHSLVQANNVSFCYHQFDYSLDHLYAVLPDVLEWQIDYIKKQGIDFIGIEAMVKEYHTPLAEGAQSVLLSVDDGWKNFNLVVPLIEKEKIPVSLFIYPAVLNHDPGYFSQADLDRLLRSPWFEFGGHSKTHVVLRHKSDTALQQELVESKQILEKMLSRKIDTFAYPYGMFDKKTKAWAEANYQLAFGVNDGSNTLKTDPYNLNRYVVYKTTTFGEFIAEVEHVQGRQRKTAYETVALDLGRGTDKYFIFTTVRLFKYPAENKQRTLLVLPSSQVGPGWGYRLIESCQQSRTEVYAMVNRNNNLPFYRPVKEMRDLVTWGLSEYQDDLRKTLDYILAREKTLEIITWGDGFDLLMSVLASSENYLPRITKVYTVNPSLLNTTNSSEAFRVERDELVKQLANGEYATPKLSFYLKMKTLADLMIIKPEAMSPFAKQLGYAELSNRELFLEEMDKEEHPILGLPTEPAAEQMAIFNQAFMQPLPLLSMVVPISWLRDLNELWYSGFNQPGLGITGREKINCETICLYADNFEENFKRIENTFPNLKLREQRLQNNPSTVEILLADQVIREVAGNTLTATGMGSQ